MNRLADPSCPFDGRSQGSSPHAPLRSHEIEYKLTPKTQCIQYAPLHSVIPSLISHSLASRFTHDLIAYSELIHRSLRLSVRFFVALTVLDPSNHGPIPLSDLSSVLHIPSSSSAPTPPIPPTPPAPLQYCPTWLVRTLLR